MDDQQHIKHLFTRYLDRGCTDQELDQLVEYINTADNDHVLQEMIRIELEKENNNYQDHPAVRSVLARTDRNLFEKFKVLRNQEKGKRRILWERFGKVAAVLLIGGMSTWLFLPKQDDKAMMVAEISPGKNTATLTLADGRKIRLSDTQNGELTKEGEVSISKTADQQLVYASNGTDAVSAGKLNTLSTSKGETYRLRLPDGTQVWLNTTSTLRYPTTFKGTGKRKVVLTGEAYFEVAKVSGMPFIVETEQQEIAVLGTHFNVNAYAEEDHVKTTLLEGRVRVGALAHKGVFKSVILRPGQQARLKGRHIHVLAVDVEEAVAWKNGYFMFDSEEISSVMRKIGRWYNVDVVYKDGLLTERFNGTIERKANVSEVLKILEMTNRVHFKVEGRKIIVSK